MSDVELEPSRAEGDRLSPVLLDVLIGALVFGAVAAAINAGVEADGREPDVLAYLFAVALGALMLLRRRWPVGTLLATTVVLMGYYSFDYPPVGLAVPMAAALYTAAEAGHLRWAVGTSVWLVVTSSVARLLEGDDASLIFGYELAASGLLLAAVVALGDAVRSRRGWQAETERRTRLAEIERETEAARRVEQERLRIARDLHDVLAHTVSVISIQADVASEALHEDLGQTEAALRTIRSSSRDALTDLRATLGLLRKTGEPRDPVSGVGDLDRVVATAVESGLRVDVSIEGTPVSLPAVVDAAAHRIVQESLTNVLRHSNADQATVELRYEPETLAVSVVDDGRGESVNGASVNGGSVNGAGFGIRGMRERVELLGGELQAGTAPEGGFRVYATLPLRESS